MYVHVYVYPMGKFCVESMQGGAKGKAQLRLFQGCMKAIIFPNDLWSHAMVG